MAANRTKTIRYFFDTRITDLPTNTTLATATRHDYTAINVNIPETGSRTFVSAVLRMSFRDNFTVANEVIAIRTGIKLGAVAFADTDRTFTQANTGDHCYDEWTLDVTSYFNANYGTGTTQTCQAGIAVATTSASNIGGNITAELILTYSFDDSVGTTRVKTIGIPIGSHASTLTITQAEIGSDGTNPPPANQIPALNTLLKEASIAIQQAAFVIECNDANSAGTTALAPQIQIDSATAVNRAPVGQALTTPIVYRDIFIYDTTTFSTASAHALKMRDNTTTGRFNSVGAVLWVTYTYNASTTTRMLNQALVPLVQSENDGGNNANAFSNTTNVSADAEVLYAILDIQEPGTITIEQSAVLLRCNVVSNAGTALVSAGTQAFRTYTPAASAMGEWLIHHRTDCNTGAWTLARGENRLPVSMYSSASPGRTALQHGWALVLYSSDVPSTGTEVGNRILHTNNCVFGTTPSTALDVAASGGGQISPSFFAPWRLNGAVLTGRLRTSGSVKYQTFLQHLTGEWDPGFSGSAQPTGYGLNELCCWGYEIGLTRSFNDHYLISGKMAPESTHRLMAFATLASLFSASFFWTVHNVSFSVSGVVTVGGSPVADGQTVEIWAYKVSTNQAERVTTATTSGGTGTFSATVMDNTRTYFVTYSSSPSFGKSASQAPGSTFNIAIGGGSDVTDPTIVTISQPATSSDALVVSVGDVSSLSLYQVTCKDRPDGPRFMVYSPVDGGFVHPFGGKSTVTGSGTLANPYVFTIYRRGRWPTGIVLDVRVQAVDTQGNETNA